MPMLRFDIITLAMKTSSETHTAELKSHRFR
jgi:hypothetical protein